MEVVSTFLQQQIDHQDVPGVSTWNVDVLLQIVKEMVGMTVVFFCTYKIFFTCCLYWFNNFSLFIKNQNPHINWRDVVSNLDHPKFLVSGRKGLRIIVQALLRSLQDPFPIDYIYKPWNNTEGQVIKAIDN